ncbi:MAG: hypothetical protein GC191_12150 [Azospirillum sp.]|nr:hypothetical protein [Azospirillum sp.]
MIRLNLPREPYWLSLPHGVRVQVRPIDTAIDAAAREMAVDMVRAEAATLTRPALGGRVVQALATATGQLAILAWEGVLPAEGSEPVPVKPEAVAQLMAIPELARSFAKQYFAPLDRIAAEGEASGAVPGGITGAAPDTAEDAHMMKAA